MDADEENMPEARQLLEHSPVYGSSTTNSTDYDKPFPVAFRLSTSALLCLSGVSERGVLAMRLPDVSDGIKNTTGESNSTIYSCMHFQSPMCE